MLFTCPHCENPSLIKLNNSKLEACTIDANELIDYNSLVGIKKILQKMTKTEYKEVIEYLFRKNKG